MRVSALLGVLLLAGCTDSGSGANKEWDPAELGDLPGARRTANAQLLDELARLDEERMTPVALAAQDVDDAENAAAALEGLFPKSRLAGILERSESLVRRANVSSDAADAEAAANFRRSYHPQQQQAREALGRKHCDFKIRHTSGFFADTSLCEIAIICARLELIEAIERVAADEPAAAIAPLGYALRWAQLLAAEPLLMPRLEAAFLRAEVLSVIDRISQHPACSKQILGELHGLLTEQLDNWPEDNRAWIGDRAIGLHTFEVVRAGLGDLLLSEDDVRVLGEEVLLSQVVRPDLRALDADEAYYLRTMRKIVERSSEPYYRRQALLETIQAELDRPAVDDGFPVISARILLNDIEQGHEIQARDRAACEAWAFALAVAAGLPPPPYETSPLSGKPYRVVETDTEVAVWGADTSPEGDQLRAIVRRPSGGNRH